VDIPRYINDPGVQDALDFYITSRDLESPPWPRSWQLWPYRGMRFYLALKREEAKCDAEDREEQMKSR